MQICEDHWNQLRKAIANRGLARFVARDGEEIARKMAEPASDKDGFDPLMSANLAIISNLVSAFGPEVLGYEGCGLCGAIEHCGCEDEVCAYTTWIDRAADDEKDRAIELGLVGQG